MLAEGTQTPFVAKIVVLLILVLKELVILLVDGVVGQVHVPVVLVDLLRVGLRGKTGQSLLIDINLHGFITSYEGVDSQIKLVTINQERIRDVLADNRSLIHIHIIDIIHQVDASPLARVGRLHNPYILLALVLLQFLIVIVEVAELIRQDVSVWAEVERRLAKSFLHAHDVEAESVFSGDFITLGEMVDLLILIEAFILVRLA
jgi:hypothetical protein